VIIVITSMLAIAVIAFILTIRPRDLPAAEPESPFAHLDDRKAAIYENLRDLQFEYRLGKLSDTDYQSTKKDLQKELAAVLAEVDHLRTQLASKTGRAPETKPIVFVCPSCGATFEKSLKFCGECGKSMKAASA
jgi:rubrerythrin